MRIRKIGSILSIISQALISGENLNLNQRGLVIYAIELQKIYK